MRYENQLVSFEVVVGISVVVELNAGVVVEVGIVSLETSFSFSYSSKKSDIVVVAKVVD